MAIINNDKIVDALLVIEFQCGNRKAMATLVKRWHPKLCKQAFWYTHDLDIAKDIVQDSWGHILAKIHHIRDPNFFGTWAFKIVTRNAIDWARKHKKERIELKMYYDNTNQSFDDNSSIGTDDNLLTLQKAIKNLPFKQQQILTLFYMEELSLKEISNILSISTGTIKSRLFTAREQIKLIFKNSNYEK